jgi:hypothetical protein
VNESAQYFLLLDLSNDSWLRCCRHYDCCDRKPGDFGAVCVSRVLHCSECGAAECVNKRAAQKIESSWCERVTSIPALMCSVVFFSVCLFYSILVCFILFYSIFLYCIPFYSILFCSIVFCFIQFYSNSVCFIFILFCFFFLF